MALKTAYATAAQSQTYLADKSDWLALTDAQQDAYLLNATYYMDANYACTWSDTPEDEQAYGCSLLGYQDFLNGLYVVDNTNGGVVVEKESKAGSVSTRTKYAGENSAGSIGFIDPYPQVTAVLGSYCSLKKGSYRAALVRT